MTVSGPEARWHNLKRAGCRPDSNRESLRIGPPALRPAEGRPGADLEAFPARLEAGRNPTRKADFRPESTVARSAVARTTMAAGWAAAEVSNGTRAGVGRVGGAKAPGCMQRTRLSQKGPENF